MTNQKILSSYWTCCELGQIKMEINQNVIITQNAIVSVFAKKSKMVRIYWQFRNTWINIQDSLLNNYFTGRNFMFNFSFLLGLKQR